MPRSIFATVVIGALIASPASAGSPKPVKSPSPHTLQVVATAYCQQGKTESGARARTGVVAADPRVLPLGSVVRIDAPGESYAGVYTVSDTGAAVKGHTIDIFMADCARAKAFGKKRLRVQLVRRGRGQSRPM